MDERHRHRRPRTWLAPEGRGGDNAGTPMKVPRVAAASACDSAARAALTVKRPTFDLMNALGPNAVAEMLGAFWSRYQAKMPFAIRHGAQGSSAEHVKL